MRSLYLKTAVFFFIIVLVSITGYYFITTNMATEKNISLLINVAGRERMLTEKLNKNAIELVYMDNENGKAELLVTGKEFAENLHGLISVKDNLGLNQAAEKELDSYLKEVENHWHILWNDFNLLISGQEYSDSIIEQINSKSDEMIGKLDTVVSFLEMKGNQSIRGLTTENMILSLLNVLFLIIVFIIWRLLAGLSKSEQKYRLLLEQAPIGIMVLENKKVSLLNKHAMKVIGESNKKNIIGKPIFTYIHPDDHSLASNRFENIYDVNQASQVVEQRWKTKNGDTLHVEVTSIPFEMVGENVILTIFQDVTNAKQSKNEMEHIFKELNDIKAALERSSIVEIADSKGIIQYVNDKFCELTKFNKEELVGKTYRDLNSGYHNKEFFQGLWETIQAGHVWEGEVRNRAKDGSYYWVDTIIIPFINQEGKPYQFLTIRNNITSRKKAESEMKKLANRDHLTHLSNRRVFEFALKNAIEKNEPVAVLFLDLDRFKFINDSLGHSIGDKLITLVAKRLKEVVGKGGIISRQGGDEFTILVPYENKESIVAIATNIIHHIKQPYHLAQKEIFITGSVGISLYPDDGEDIEILLQNADVAMYWCKDNGKDGYSFYKQHMREKSDRTLQLQLELRKAIENEELLLFYQPKLDLLTNEIMGYEALVRWNHPTMGIISPGEFIPLAEETGLINEIGNWVLRESSKQNQKWREAGFSDLLLSVNLSAHQFKQPNLVQMVKQVLLETNIEPRYLELEITESISMLEENLIIEQLFALKELGVRIAIDDFGTGYSSLQYLNKLPVDTIKIDKSFVKDIDNLDNFTTALMTNAIISLAKSLNMNVVAEGIETWNQLNYLKKYQCDIGQGYYISKPLPSDQFEQFLQNQLKDQAISIAST